MLTVTLNYNLRYSVEKVCLNNGYDAGCLRVCFFLVVSSWPVQLTSTWPWFDLSHHRARTHLRFTFRASRKWCASFFSPLPCDSYWQFLGLRIVISDRIGQIWAGMGSDGACFHVSTPGWRMHETNLMSPIWIEKCPQALSTVCYNLSLYVSLARRYELIVNCMSHRNRKWCHPETGSDAMHAFCNTYIYTQTSGDLGNKIATFLTSPIRTYMVKVPYLAAAWPCILHHSIRQLLFILPNLFRLLSPP